MTENNVHEPSPSEQPYDPAEDPDSDPENRFHHAPRQPNQAEGADETDGS
ncbi:hypothetical protein [Rhodococcus sp. OK302]|jgi:hypothetical protein|nr:hypothetical protein [Rhodococcus sp. OK302]OYD60925.1 hypothetical protein BDB13_5829 [Rhodococcus sp. OK302]